MQLLNFKNAFLIFIIGLFLCFDSANAGVTASYKPKIKAEDSIYEIDPQHSSIHFSIRHLVSVVRGQFRQFNGQIRFDPKLQDSAVQVNIDPMSIDTNQEKRDEDLRSPRFFNVDKFPKITFKSKRVTEQSIIGDLTLMGITKEVVLNYIFHGSLTDLKGEKRIGFSATAMIRRNDFGIFYNKDVTSDVKLLGDEVPIEIEVQAVLKVK